MSAVDEAIRKANSGGLDWMVDRVKADIKNIMGVWIIPEHVNIGPSKFYQGKDNAIIAVSGQEGIFYRINSDVVVRKLGDIESALKQEDLAWTEIAIRISEKQSQNNRYYDLEVCRADDIPAGEPRPFPGAGQQRQPGRQAAQGTGRQGQPQQSDARSGGRRVATF
jgi:hypothetical protein